MNETSKQEIEVSYKDLIRLIDKLILNENDFDFIHIN